MHWGHYDSPYMTYLPFSSALFSSVQQAQDKKKEDSVESAVFVITNNGRICLPLSISESQLGHLISTIGLSTYTAKEYLPENLKEKEGQLWKLKNATTYYKETISLTYPKEMELHPDPNNENHFGIRPVEDVDVEPAKFRQVSTA